MLSTPRQARIIGYYKFFFAILMLDEGVDRVNQIGRDFTRILFMTIRSGEKKKSGILGC